MAAHCERLEEEIRMLRRSIRVLSAKHASLGDPHMRTRRVWPRRSSRIAKAVALIATMMLTWAGWAVPQRTQGCRQPAEVGLDRSLLAFAGFR